MTASSRAPAEADESLFARYRGGEIAAFSELVRRHERPLFNFALRHVRAASTAEDIVQEVFTRVVQSADSFKEEARFTTWLYTIARNLCVDQLRKAGHRRHASLDEGQDGDSPTLGERVPSSGAAVDRVVIGRQLADEITEAVQALPEDQREVFLLRHVAEMPFREIAEVVGINENTVKSRMRYALERLQTALVEFEEYARALR